MKPQIDTKIAANVVVVLGLLLGFGASTRGQTVAVGVETNSSAATSPALAATNQASADPINIIGPTRVSLPPALVDVVRMCEAGIKDELVIAYVKNSERAYNLTADQIVYLRDIGISSAVIQALLEQTGSESEALATAPTYETPPAEMVAATNVVMQPTTNINVFYTALAPYGTWVDLPSYGWCWQPTVVALNPTWRPYSDHGYWLWSDHGWYWNSYYSWGWAPFHYGRWFDHPRRGWLWCPDRVWGPAWVSWRSTPDYCGWAPLPPGAHFSASIGWTFWGASVGVNFGFGLPSSCYTFVPLRNFCDRRPARHFLNRAQVEDAFQRSTVVNRFDADDRRRFVNRGIERSRVEAATSTPIREVAVRELPANRESFQRPDRLERRADSQVIYRPDQRLSVPANPSLEGLRRESELRAVRNTRSVLAREREANRLTSRDGSDGRGLQRSDDRASPSVTRPGGTADRSSALTERAGSVERNRPTASTQRPTQHFQRARPQSETPRSQFVAPNPRSSIILRPTPGTRIERGPANRSSRQSIGPSRTMIRPTPTPQRSPTIIQRPSMPRFQTPRVPSTPQIRPSTPSRSPAIRGSSRPTSPARGDAVRSGSQNQRPGRR